jgi:hydroxyacylglutathione hydrolase
MFTVGPVQENCFVFRRDGSDRGVIVDPGEEAPVILTAIEQLGLQIEAVLVTHCHFDHVGAVAPVAEATGAPVYVSEIEKPVLASDRTRATRPTTRFPAGKRSSWRDSRSR